MCFISDDNSWQFNYYCKCLSLFQWAYELGQASEMKVSVPLHGCEHFYLLTKPLQEQLPPSTPGIRCQTTRYKN